MKTLTAFYDLAVGPVSYDFVVFMVKAEMVRRRHKLDKLHIIIMPDEKGVGGMFRDKTALYDLHEMHWRLQNICLPAAQLLRASVCLAPSREWALDVGAHIHDYHQPLNLVWPADWDKQTLKRRHHLVGDIIEWSVKEPVPVLQASEHARRAVRLFYNSLSKGRPVVTMTRRHTYNPLRNSDSEQWEKAKAYIEECGYTVVDIEDTADALKGGSGYAALNIDLRMACYQEAVLNLQANNGAASLCWFSDKPYRMFGAGVDVEEWDGLFVKQGLPLGATWPWAREQQKLVYGKETADTIIEEFEAWAGVTK
jgi:hypothetical protein